jgi:hypothetical protein
LRRSATPARASLEFQIEMTPTSLSLREQINC